MLIHQYHLYVTKTDHQQVVLAISKYPQDYKSLMSKLYLFSDKGSLPKPCVDEKYQLKPEDVPVVQDSQGFGEAKNLDFTRAIGE